MLNQSRCKTIQEITVSDDYQTTPHTVIVDVTITKKNATSTMQSNNDLFPINSYTLSVDIIASYIIMDHPTDM